MNKKIFSGLILIGIAVLMVLNYIGTDDKQKMQIIKYNNFDYSKEIIKEIKIKVNDEIKLEKYDGNNLKILEITDEFVKISRVAIKYEIINQSTNKITGESREYKETVVEEVEYNELIPVDINENDPFGPAFTQLQYNYYIKFIK